jgi:anthranilate phosphoribosyltransferase
VLAAAGRRIDATSEEAARQIADPAVGWAYVDQARFCPALDALRELRAEIVKRPCLSTLEKLMGPVRARGQTHLVVGYVHRGYERLLPLCARAAGYASALVLRGVEGGIVPPLDAPAPFTVLRAGGGEEALRTDPGGAGITSSVRAVPLPDGAEATAERLAGPAAEAGEVALDGAPGPTRDSVVLAAATILHVLGRVPSLAAAAAAARTALDTGAARERFRRA